MTAETNQIKNDPDERVADNCDLDTIHIQIGENGEINAWGLDQDAEENILERTGNQKLVESQQKMSYTLCG